MGQQIAPELAARMDQQGSMPLALLGQAQDLARESLARYRAQRITIDAGEEAMISSVNTRSQSQLDEIMASIRHHEQEIEALRKDQAAARRYADDERASLKAKFAEQRTAIDALIAGEVARLEALALGAPGASN